MQTEYKTKIASGMSKQAYLGDVILDYRQVITSSSSAKSAINHSSRIRRFLHFLREEQQLELSHRISPFDVDRYVDYLESALGASPNTVNSFLSTYDKVAPALGLPGSSLGRRPRFESDEDLSLSKDELSRLLRALPTLKLRNQVLILLMLQTDIRLCEVQTLRKRDLKETGTETRLSLPEKPNRQFILGAEVQQALVQWLDERRQSAWDSELLFVTNCGRPLSIRGIDYIIRRTGWLCRVELHAERLRQTNVLT